MMILLALLLSLVLFGYTNSFTIVDHPLSSTRCNIISFASADDSESSIDTTKNRADLRYIDESIQRQISNIFSSSSGQLDGSIGSTFVPLSFAGRHKTQKIDNEQSSSVFASSSNIETIFLSTPEQCQSISEAYIQYLKTDTSSSSKSNTYKPSTTIKALPIPISQSSYTTNTLKLLSTTYTNQPLSKSVLLSLNSLFTNRDNGLYDNLPWSTWSIDPQLTERDAANNTIDEKYTMGKRVAYQRLMGKDWQGRSLSLGNLILKVRYLLERDDDDDDDDIDKGRDTDDSGEEDTDDSDMLYSLSKRLLQLEIKEAQMYIAECEQRVAIATNNNEEDDGTGSDIDEATEQLDKARERLQLAETSLDELNKTDNTSSSKQSKTPQSLVTSILDKFTKQDNPPPYRGAIGYPAKQDTKQEMLEDSVLPYSSPYELLLEIIDEQLNSKVIGCVLEPTSLIEGNLVLGGALLLQRKGVVKTTSISGESISYTDDDDELGNKGVLPRSMYAVECYADEAIGMAMAANMPIFVEEDIHTRAGQIEVELDIEQADSIKEDNGNEENQVVESMDSLSFTNRIPLVRPIDESYLSSQVEGERISSEKESNQVRIPLTTNPDFFDGSQAPSSSSSRSVFSTFNPVKSLGEYDELTDDAKARLLLKLESFTGQLPRPRAVRMSSNSNNGPSILDEMLIPLVDETIRRQYRIRDAERRNDIQEVERLRKEASPRQEALERLQQAKEEEELLGIDNEEAIRLAEEEAELYKALRADITQDEGAYSQYLDRDEWYERETQARIQRERERQLRKKS